jgi:hypothetical protein
MDISMNTIKDVLIELYKPILEKYFNQLVEYWLMFGMKELANILKTKKATFEDIVMSEYYGLTVLDLWLLSGKFDVNIILFASTKFIENNNVLLPLNNNIKGYFYIIQLPIKYAQNTRIKVLESSKGSISIQKQEVLPLFNETLESLPMSDPIEFIKNYKRPVRIRGKKLLEIE